MKKYPACSFALAALVISCTEGGGSQPAPVRLDAAIDTPLVDVGVEASLAPEVGPVRRKVLYRSPFGNLNETGNLMVDGDFEWSASLNAFSQTPWQLFSPNLEPKALQFETGGLCRSGLRCVRISSNDQMLGFGTSPTHSDLEISAWAKVDADNCRIVNVTVFSSMTLNSMFAVDPIDDKPNEDGWCHFQGVKPQFDEAVALHIELTAFTLLVSALIDDVVIRPADGLSPLSLRPVSPTTRERIRASMQAWRRHRVVGVAPDDLSTPPRSLDRRNGHGP